LHSQLIDLSKRQSYLSSVRLFQDRAVPFVIVSTIVNEVVILITKLKKFY
jgi:hypothetical protein